MLRQTPSQRLCRGKGFSSIRTTISSLALTVISLLLTIVRPRSAPEGAAAGVFSAVVHQTREALLVPSQLTAHSIPKRGIYFSDALY